MIKWAEYISKDNILYIPHYSWDFWACDCDRYLLLDQLKDIYSDDFIRDNEYNYIEYNDILYYYAEYEPVVTKDFELISDIFDLYLER